MSDQRETSSSEPLISARERIQSVGDEDVRARLLKTLVLWEMDYLREAVSQFRIIAEEALRRLVRGLDGCGADDAASAAHGRALAERGQSSKLVQWLHQDKQRIPARIALHLHTLLGWGNYASHHQASGHKVAASDLALLVAIAMDLEEWVATEVEGRPSILRAKAESLQAEALHRRAVAAGAPEAASAILLDRAGQSARLEACRLYDPGRGVELYFGPLGPDQQPRTELQGLLPFEPRDAPSFVGRERCLQQILEALQAGRPAVLSGEAGAGKTSLLRAGLIPHALQRDYQVLFIGEPTAESLSTTVSIVGAWPPDRPLLLVIDQLERGLFALTDAAVRQLAIELTVRAARWKGIALVAALREDTLGRYWRDVRRIAAGDTQALTRDHCLVVVDRFDHDEARAVVCRLLELSGLSMMPELLEERLLPALCKSGGASPAHLQLVCRALIERARAANEHAIGNELYEAAGGARQVLSAYLEQTLAGTRYAEDRVAARTILKCMAGKDGRRWVDHGELWQALRRAGHQADELFLIGILQRLQADRLVVSRTTGELDATQYSLCHDLIAVEVASWRTAAELERERARELLEQAIRSWRYDGARETLAGQQLALVERHWPSLERDDPALAEQVLQRSQRARRARRLLVISLLMLAGGAALFGAWQLSSALRQEARARAAADRGILLSARLALQRDPSLAVAWLRHVSSDQQGLATRALLTEARRRGVARVLSGHRDLVTSVDFSPDQIRLVSASRDGTVRLWSLGRPAARLRTLRGHRGYVTRAVFSPDGHVIATAGWDETIRLWDGTSGSPLGQPLRGHRGWVYDLAFSPDGKALASVGLDGTVRLWNIASRREIRSIRGSQQGLLSVAFAADGKQVVAAGVDGLVRVWEIDSRELLASLEGHTDQVYALRVAASGTKLLTASKDSTIRIWSLPAGRPIATLRGHTDEVIALGVSPDGRYAASAGEDKLIYLWDLETARVRGLPLRGHRSFIRALDFSPDGQLLASASHDQTIRLWHLPSRTSDHATRRLAHESWVQALSFIDDSRVLATGTRDGSLHSWNVTSAKPVDRQPHAHRSPLIGLELTVRGRFLVSAARDGEIKTWSASPVLEQRATAQSPQAAGVHALAGGRGNTFYTGGGDGTIQRWRVGSAGSLALDGDATAAHNKAVVALRAAPDGRLLASASRDRLVRLWDPDTLAPTEDVLRGHSDTVYDLCFSPDGRRLASASGDGTLRLWSLGAEVHAGNVLVGHQHWVLCCAFAPAGEVLASGGSDSTLRLWNPAGLQQLAAPLFGHDDWVYALRYSPDGRWLASASGDKTVRLWSTTRDSEASIRAEIDSLTNLHVSKNGKTFVP